MLSWQLRLAAEANDLLAGAIRCHPTRFAGLAAVAPQDPAAAAREIERGATRLGLRCVIVNSHTKGEYLDQPRYRPILEAAEAFDLPIYLIPREPAPSMIAPYLDHGLYFSTWGFSAEVDCACHAPDHVGNVRSSSQVEDHPGTHGRGPSVLAATDRQSPCRAGEDRHRRETGQAAQRVLFDNFFITTSGVASMPALRSAWTCSAWTGSCLPSIIPTKPTAEAVRFMDGAQVSEEERKQIYETNARRVFKLEV